MGSLCPCRCGSSVLMRHAHAPTAAAAYYPSHAQDVRFIHDFVNLQASFCTVLHL
jgi:hypothetical protein